MTTEDVLDVLESLKDENLNLDNEYTKNRFEGLKRAIRAVERLDLIEEAIDYYDNLENCESCQGFKEVTPDTILASIRRILL